MGKAKNRKSRPKRHHYVPVSYLKKFAEPSSGFLYVLDIVKKEIRKQKPDQVMLVGNYYRQTGVPPEIDQNILEHRLGVLEGKAKPSFDKLITNAATFNLDDSSNIIVYMNFQRIRVPRQHKVFDQILKSDIETVAHSIPEVDQELSTGRYKLTITESAKFLYMKLMTNSNVYTDIFSTMIWRILEAPKHRPFVTTDSPVSFYNSMIKPPNEAGPGLLGTLVFFPLSPFHLLELRHRQKDGCTEERYLERLPVQRLKEGDITIQINYLLPEQIVDGINRTLALLADRYIVSTEQETVNRIQYEIL
jgi:hypothetical protein